MKVILNEDVPNLGEEGDICDVADGYGRNYLLPKSLAVPHTKQNLALFEHRREAIEKRKEEKRQAARSLKERLEAEPLVIQRPAGETGKLFGSVSSASVVEDLEKKGISIERKRIDLPQSSLKMIGNYPVRVKLYDNETAQMQLTIEGLDKEGNVIELKVAQRKREEQEAARAAAEAETAATEATEETAAAETEAEAEASGAADGAEVPADASDQDKAAVEES